MSIETTLCKVDKEIAAGDLGKARDRLQGLLRTYPNNLKIRYKLGEIFWRLQYPAMAGRYWYLEEPASAEMQSAREAFEKSCGNNPICMLDAIRFQGDISALEGTFAGSTLRSLITRAEEEFGFKYNFDRDRPVSYKPRWWDQLVVPGCILILIVLLVLATIGITTVLGWLF